MFRLSDGKDNEMRKTHRREFANYRAVCRESQSESAAKNDFVNRNKLTKFIYLLRATAVPRNGSRMAEERRDVFAIVAR
jgi:hypothetical protein